MHVALPPSLATAHADSSGPIITMSSSHGPRTTWQNKSTSQTYACINQPARFVNRLPFVTAIVLSLVVASHVILHKNHPSLHQNYPSLFVSSRKGQVSFLIQPKYNYHSSFIHSFSSNVYRHFFSPSFGHLNSKRTQINAHLHTLPILSFSLFAQD